jgi:transcription elongation factor Elf1
METKARIESLMPRQKRGEALPCLRCGQDRMSETPVRNALSRRADVYICDECGTDEALRDMAGAPPLPLREWSAAKESDQFNL